MATATTTTKFQLFESRVTGASGGFGMFQMGEAVLFGGEHGSDSWDTMFDDPQTAVAVWKDCCADSDVYLTETNEIDGKIYNQNSAHIFKGENADGEDLGYFAATVSEYAG